MEGFLRRRKRGGGKETIPRAQEHCGSLRVTTTAVAWSLRVQSNVSNLTARSVGGGPPKNLLKTTTGNKGADREDSRQRVH